jgi:hypothetical protein
MRAHHDGTLLIPVDQEVCFSDHEGTLDERSKKQQISYLRKLEPVIRHYLNTDEKVLYVTRCQWPQSFIDILTSGWLAYFMNQAMIIVTSNRVIFFHVKSDNSPTGSLSQANFGDIVSCRKTGFGQSLLFTFQSGKLERFSGMPTKSSKKIVKILEEKVSGDQLADRGERHYLCPRCKTKLVKGQYTCPICNLQFKDPSTAIKYGLLFPGGGFFYMRKKFFGFQYAFTEILLLCLLICALSSMAYDPPLIGLAIVAAILIVITKTIHVFRVRGYTAEYVPAQADDSKMHYS